MQRLSESKPEEIRQVCAQAIQGGQPRAAEAAAWLIRLDYAQLDDDTITAVEDTLHLAMTGEERQVSDARPAPCPVPASQP